MKRFVEGADRGQSTLLPECVDDWIDEENPVRAIDTFVEALDLKELGFDGVDPAATGRPSFHPSIYGYLNRVQSSRRLEREAGRNLELLWLLGRLVPDHKTIADFRKDNGLALRKVCARFIDLCTLPKPMTSGAKSSCFVFDCFQCLAVGDKRSNTSTRQSCRGRGRRSQTHRLNLKRLKVGGASNC